MWSLMNIVNNVQGSRGRLRWSRRLGEITFVGNFSKCPALTFTDVSQQTRQSGDSW